MGLISYPLLVADFPQMNFSQMHEKLRLELLRRIQRGTLSVSLLARQTGFGQSHLSNFLNSRRQLSMEAIDRLLAAQHLTAADLLPAPQSSIEMPFEVERDSVPLVSHHSALFEPYIRTAAAQGWLHLPPGLLQTIRSRAANSRRAWQRFVAVRIPADDSAAMDPIVLPEAITLIDRHYNSLHPYRPNRPNLLAIRNGGRLSIRYADFLANRLVLRPHFTGSPVELIELAPGESPMDVIAGRVALILNEP
jgi:transcriptional regulator with XRE-family HTH domain